ncbi:hypothetical protein DPV99_05390 [Aggregatibacter aphrophilus]|nr:hypothetical protein [Pasteurellaceae bacterium LIM206]RDF02157.1 hypothetical protein DPV99_05390 [Aggregatibacter aphrophilus]DAO11693.1 MAG TPA: hypothetical protein [Caudoviricetes sp.]
MLTEFEQKFLQIIREHRHEVKKVLAGKTQSDTLSIAQSNQDDFQAMSVVHKLILLLLSELPLEQRVSLAWIILTQLDLSSDPTPCALHRLWLQWRTFAQSNPLGWGVCHFPSVSPSDNK